MHRNNELTAQTRNIGACSEANYTTEQSVLFHSYYAQHTDELSTACQSAQNNNQYMPSTQLYYYYTRLLLLLQPIYSSLNFVWDYLGKPTNGLFTRTTSVRWY